MMTDWLTLHLVESSLRSL